MTNFLKNPIVHGLVWALCLALGYVIAQGFNWESITIGAVLKGGYQWLSNFLEQPAS